ncbi:sugar phosphate isomerase/epimerase family protein [Verminephrobacter eiseniae]|uniref:sugar phosphate isomerase/epimerase family protein n=1 Tax=Verminephrobacter eiseniae TaxID=364317 RepID=UPI002238EDC3|nr:sugar phosphate isomerase/epimerase [Verminephrobacter eiseniae]MCW5237496.1 sugar phosphate isomerase/epimerase [Verminephrobacter eiseniae]
MNTLGIHALVWAGDFTSVSARKVIESSKRAGYGLVEISLHAPVMDIALTRDLLQEFDMQIACSRGLSFAADISSEDPECVRRGIAKLQEGITMTAQLGGNYFGGVLYGALAKYPGPITEKERYNAMESMKRMADFAATKGITLGLEVVNRYESNQLNTALQALEMLDKLNAPGVKVHLDTYHMNIEETDFLRPVLACGERLGYVHVGESHRGYLGSGTIDFPEFFRALASIGYEGVITFESFSSAVVNHDLSNTLAVWRNLWSDGMDLAKHARQFIADGMGNARKASNASNA